MSNYRSLEHKIRDLMQESANRNTAARMKVKNVGRPEDDPKNADTTKLAKQAEIKTKIIDEAARKVKEDDQTDDAINRINAVAGNLKQMTSEPKPAPTLPHVDDHDIDIVKTGMKKITKEEAEQIDEISKETLKSYVKAVDKRGEGVKRGTGLNTASQKIAKQEPTSTLKKTVDAIKNTPHGKMKSSSVYKFGASHAELQRRGMREEAEQIDELDHQQGSILNRYIRKTTDNPKRKEGRTLALKKRWGDKTYGLPEPKVKAVHREEAEQVDEGNPANKAKKNAAVSDIGAKNRDTHYLDRMNPKVADKIRGREVTQGKDRQQHNEEIEQIDELTSKTLKSYIEKSREVKPDETPLKSYNRLVGGARAARRIDKQSEVKEASDATDTDSVKLTKNKKPDMDDKDAKEIKGGKTEVIMNPKTDERPEDSSMEDKKSQKAMKDENKKIGAKSGVKEETMLKSDKAFGLPADLINTVTEALKGKQHKIDANKNGKIDAEDFKMLRGKKGMKEEVELSAEELARIEEIAKSLK
jgi:hypothetical protein